MAKTGPDRELRARDPENLTDPNAAIYKAYSHGRLRGAVIPVVDGPEDARWKALDLEGNVTFWRYRNQARDHLCSLPARPVRSTGA